MARARLLAIALLAIIIALPAIAQSPTLTITGVPAAASTARLATRERSSRVRYA